MTEFSCNYSYDFVESYRDNWWCEGWGKPPESVPSVYPSLYHGPVAFLAPEQGKSAEQELRLLMGQGEAELYLGELILDYAKANLKDLDLPEALYLVMRMAAYSCYDWAETEAEKAKQAKERSMARQAASLLWHNFPKSIWTEKARPLGQ